MVRAVAPPFPGAFAVLDDREVLFVSSRLTGEAARDPDLVPCLYALGGELFLGMRRRRASVDR